MLKRTIEERKDRPEVFDKLRRCRLSGGWLVASLIFLLAGCAPVPNQSGSTAVAVTKLRGKGYVLSYPAYWSREASDNAVALNNSGGADLLFDRAYCVKPRRGVQQLAGKLPGGFLRKS
jgi:hypothetical protein